MVLDPSIRLPPQYRPIEEIGRGGMGRVVRAFDRRLRREVALKIVTGADDTVAGPTLARALREANALARVSSHPNIVTIFDVHEVDGRLVIAMELVRGQPLDRWLHTPRTWAAVVDVFIQAGRGLAASHQAGIVHRDFKPGNVLVEQAGVAKLTDFGIASMHQPEVISEPSDTSPRDEQTGEPVTQAGTTVGTPTYMAPEQYRGAMVDARADQYAFCLTLVEALSGEHPFAAPDEERMRQHKNAGPPSSLGMLPRGLEAPLRRGLQPEPEQRWPSMQRLVTELEQRRRRRPRVTGVLAMGLAAAAGIGWASSRDPRSDACAQGREQLEESWNDAARRDVSEALQAAGGAAAWQRVEPNLEAWAQGWVEAQTAACRPHERAEADSEDPVADPAATRECLRRQLHDFEALVAVLREADAGVARHAISASVTLPQPAACLDHDVGSEQVAPPHDPQVRKQVESLESALAWVQALQSSGQWQDANKTMSTLLQTVRELGYRPLLVRTLASAGRLRYHLGDGDEARSLLQEGFFLATELGMDHDAALIALSLCDVERREHHDIRSATRWLDHAEALLRGDESSPLATRVMFLRATLAFDRGESERSIELHREALALSRHHEHEGEIPDVLNALGLVLADQGHWDEALHHLEEALQLRQDRLGPEHPLVGGSLQNIGMVLTQQRRLDEAVQRLEEARRITQMSSGTGDSDTLCNLAGAYKKLGRHDDALQAVQKCVQARVERFGENHASTFDASNSLGMLLNELGRLDEGVPVLERTLVGREQTLGVDHPSVATTLTNLALAYVDLGRIDSARRAAERSLALKRDAWGDDHIILASAWGALSQVARFGGRWEEALRARQASLELYTKAYGPDDFRVAAEWVALADLHVAAGQTQQAREALQRGDEILAPGDGGNAELAAWFQLVEAQLEAQRGSSSRAITMLRQLVDRPGHTIRAEHRARAVVWLARQLVQDRRDEAAVELMDGELRTAESDLRWPWLRAELHALLARVHRRGGAKKLAASHARQAREIADRMESPPPNLQARLLDGDHQVVAP